MIKRFVSGDYGLTKTYWFGLLSLVGTSVAVFFVVLALGSVARSAFRLEGVYFVLLCVISVSIWQASGKHQGRPAWASDWARAGPRTRGDLGAVTRN